MRGRPLTSIESTPSKQYYVIDLNNRPPIYAALVDNRGVTDDVAGDQWEPARDSEILIFALDHCDTRLKGNKLDADDARLEEHKKCVNLVLARVRTGLRTDRLEPKTVIILLMKKDLWQQGKRSAENRKVD
jgi:hypothetical protein